MNKEDLIEEIRATKSSLNLICYLSIIVFICLETFIAWAIPFILERLR